MDNQETLFTAAAVLDFLSQIEELKDKDILVEDTQTGLAIVIGDNNYNISYDTAEEVEVPQEVVDEISDITDETYASVSEENDIGIWVESDEPIDDELIDADTEVVEGGIIKEALKTLAIGGLVRLTGKLVGKDIADALKS